MADVFISYSRLDSAFVHELHDVLTRAGRDVWVDWEDLGPASEWRQELREAIASADSFVCLVTANWLVSDPCAEEFSYAQESGKRIVPIACDPDEKSSPHALDETNWKALCDRNWIRPWTIRDHTATLDTLTDSEKKASFDLIEQSLDTDLDWAKAHTRLLGRATDWDTRKDRSLLLRGKDLKEAEQQLEANAAKEPRATELQQRYVHASRRAATRRQRVLLGSVVAALAVSIALGVVALLQRNTANQRAQVARSQALAAQAEAALSAAPTTALARAVDAFATSPTSEARVELRKAILANPVTYVIPAGKKAPGGLEAPDEALTFSADGKLLLSLTPDGAVHVRRAADGRTLDSAGSALVARRLRSGGHVAGVGFAGDLPLALIVDRRAAEIVNVATGRPIRSRGSRISTAVFSGAGNRVVRFERRHASVRGHVLSPNGRVFVTVNNENTAASIHRSDSGRLVAALPGFGDLNPRRLFFRTNFVPGVAFSRDGRLIALANADGIIRVWELATLKQILAVRTGWANAIAFAPRGGLLAAMTWNGDIVVARTTNRAVLTTYRYSGNLSAPRFHPEISPEGGLIATDNLDVVTVSNLDGRLEQVLRPPAVGPSGVATVAFSGDGTAVAVGARPVGASACAHPTRTSTKSDPCAHYNDLLTSIWRLGRRAPVRLLWKASGPISIGPQGSLVVVGGRAWWTATGARVPPLDATLALSRDARMALVSRGRTAEVVQVPSGRAITELRDAGPLDGASFSPDGRRVVTMRKDALRLWDARTGEPVASLGHPREIVKWYSFGASGGRVLVIFDKRAATFDAATGHPGASIAGEFGALSNDGTLAVSPRDDGTVRVVDQKTGVGVNLQTESAAPIVSVAFGPTPSLLVAEDTNGDVHVLRCAICAPDEVLLGRARTELTLVSALKPKRPSTGYGVVG